MLVLMRREGQMIYIGDGPERIRVAVVWVKGDRVGIGVDAPRTLAVHRQEVSEAIERGDKFVSKYDRQGTEDET